MTAQGTPLPADTLALVQRWLAALQAKDTAVVGQGLDDGITLVQPFSFSGRQQPDFVFEGRAAVLGYLQTVFDNFARIRFIDPLYTVSADGSRVFVETRGDFITAQGSLPYNNVYLFRFDLHNAQIVFISEYANPVPASLVLGIPLGARES